MGQDYMVLPHFLYNVIKTLNVSLSEQQDDLPGKIDNRNKSLPRKLLGFMFVIGGTQ
jgi:hypothetical protein